MPTSKAKRIKVSAVSIDGRYHVKVRNDTVYAMFAVERSDLENLRCEIDDLLGRRS